MIPNLDFLTPVPGNNKMAATLNKLKASPNDAGLWFDLGELYFLAGVAEASTQCLEAAWSLDPSDFGEYMNFACEYFNADNFDAALRLAEMVQEAGKHEADYWWHLAEFNLGKKNLDKGMNYFNEALKVDAGFIKAHVSLGYWTLFLKRPDEAYLHIQKALSLGNYGQSFLNLGHYYLIKGKRNKALECYVLSWDTFNPNEIFWTDYEHDFEIVSQYGMSAQQYAEMKEEVIKKKESFTGLPRLAAFFAIKKINHATEVQPLKRRGLLINFIGWLRKIGNVLLHYFSAHGNHSITAKQEEQLRKWQYPDTFIEWLKICNSRYEYQFEFRRQYADMRLADFEDIKQSQQPGSYYYDLNKGGYLIFGKSGAEGNIMVFDMNDKGRIKCIDNNHYSRLTLNADKARDTGYVPVKAFMGKSYFSFEEMLKAHMDNMIINSSWE
jgi:tetratricopeptide (TPR) repeat protein